MLYKWVPAEEVDIQLIALYLQSWHLLAAHISGQEQQLPNHMYDMWKDL